MKRIAALATVVTLLLAACSGTGPSTSDDPKDALVDALRALLESDAYTQTITVDSDTASLVALGEGAINQETAASILDSNITASARTAENPEDATSEVVVNIAGDDVIEVRFVTGDLYLRVELGALVETLGGDESQIDALTSQFRGRPGFEWVERAVAGEWVVLKGAVALIEQMGVATLGGKQQKEIVDGLLRSIEQHATVTDEGDDSNGDHVRASLPLRETVEDLVRSSGSGAEMSGAALQDAMNDIPEGDIVLDFWIDEGRVSRMSVDVTQFEAMAQERGSAFPEGVERLAIVMQIEEFTGDVEPVSDAVEIDTGALGQAFGAFLFPSGGSGSPAGDAEFDCDTLKGAPRDVIELYAEECPELQKS